MAEYRYEAPKNGKTKKEKPHKTTLSKEAKKERVIAIVVVIVLCVALIAGAIVMNVLASRG